MQKEDLPAETCAEIQSIPRILRRFTGKNFTEKNLWQNWWHAHSPNWAEDLSEK